MKNFSKIVVLSILLSLNSQVTNAETVPTSQLMSKCSLVTHMSEQVNDQISRKARVNRDSIRIVRTYGKTECWGVFNTDKGTVDIRIVEIAYDAPTGLYFATTVLYW